LPVTAQGQEKMSGVTVAARAQEQFQQHQVGQRNEQRNRSKAETAPATEVGRADGTLARRRGRAGGRAGLLRFQPGQDIRAHLINREQRRVQRFAAFGKSSTVSSEEPREERAYPEGSSTDHGRLE